MTEFAVMPSMRFLWAAGPAAKADNTTIYNCSFAKGKIKCNSADAWQWIKPHQLDTLPFPKANHYIFPHILDKGVA